jgi:adenylylsulfate kinase-like enzyme
MDQNRTCLEMAFELARSGKFTDLALLEHHLRDEGYSTSQLDGPSIRRQVRALMAAAGRIPVPATLIA